jgi:hypothetical protein
MALFKSDEQKEQEVARREAVRAMSVPELAADVLERVFASADNMIPPKTVFDRYKAARGVELTVEDQPLFSEVLQHLMNHRAIAQHAFTRTSGDYPFYILTTRGRELLDSGDTGAALAK